MANRLSDRGVMMLYWQVDLVIYIKTIWISV